MYFLGGAFRLCIFHNLDPVLLMHYLQSYNVVNVIVVSNPGRAIHTKINPCPTQEKQSKKKQVHPLILKINTGRTLV